MRAMFAASNYNKALHFDTSKVTTMQAMFVDTRHFDQSINFSSTSAVQDMSEMFAGSKFNQPLGSWNTSAVQDMSEMFAGSRFNQPLNSWNTSAVQDMSGMFAGSKFNQPLEAWAHNLRNVIDVTGMFECNEYYSHSLEAWGKSIQPYYIEDMFTCDDPSLSEIASSPPPQCAADDSNQLCGYSFNGRYNNSFTLESCLASCSPTWKEEAGHYDNPICVNDTSTACLEFDELQDAKNACIAHTECSKISAVTSFGSVWELIKRGGNFIPNPGSGTMWTTYVLTRHSYAGVTRRTDGNPGFECWCKNESLSATCDVFDSSSCFDTDMSCFSSGPCGQEPCVKENIMVTYKLNHSDNSCKIASDDHGSCYNCPTPAPTAAPTTAAPTTAAPTTAAPNPAPTAAPTDSASGIRTNPRVSGWDYTQVRHPLRLSLFREFLGTALEDQLGCDEIAKFTDAKSHHYNPHKRVFKDVPSTCAPTRFPTLSPTRSPTFSPSVSPTTLNQGTEFIIQRDEAEAEKEIVQITGIFFGLCFALVLVVALLGVVYRRYKVGRMDMTLRGKDLRELLREQKRRLLSQNQAPPAYTPRQTAKRAPRKAAKFMY